MLPKREYMLKMEQLVLLDLYYSMFFGCLWIKFSMYF